MALSIKDLNFSYGGKRIFSGFSLDLESNRVALLGPNGAGKSTLFQLIAGVLHPKKGELNIDGISLKSNPKRYLGQVGFVPQNIPIVKGFTVLDQLEYVGWLKGQSGKQAKERANRVSKLPLLEGLEKKLVSDLSGGQLRRLGIGSALTHSSKLILMDEPTAGLDALQKANFRDALASISDEISVIVSTHQTEDLFDHYPQVVVIDEGELLFNGTREEFYKHSPAELESSKRAEISLLKILQRL